MWSHISQPRGKPNYRAFVISADACTPMLQCLLPRIWDETGVVQSNPHRRSVGEAPSRSGATLFLSHECWTSSGAHYDENHSLLVNLAGRRQVWVSQGAWPTSQRFAHSPWALKPAFDPATNAVASVREVELLPGDAILIPSGVWHSVLASPGSVALGLDVRDRFNAQPSLHIWHLTYRQLDDWKSASNVEALWRGSLPSEEIRGSLPS